MFFPKLKLMLWDIILFAVNTRVLRTKRTKNLLTPLGVEDTNHGKCEYARYVRMCMYDLQHTFWRRLWPPGRVGYEDWRFVGIYKSSQI